MPRLKVSLLSHLTLTQTFHSLSKMTISQWQRILRFRTSDGKTYFGEPTATQEGTARVWVGENVWSLKPTDAIVDIEEVCVPLIISRKARKEFMR